MQTKQLTVHLYASPDCVCLPQLLFILWLMIEDHDKLFIASEVVHFGGIGILGYKLLRKRNCGGMLPQLLITCSPDRLAGLAAGTSALHQSN